jgi:hypothetical protein
MSESLGAVSGLKGATLPDGPAFGEPALTNNAPRNATIVCNEPSHLLLLNRQFYENTVQVWSSDYVVTLVALCIACLNDYVCLSVCLSQLLFACLNYCLPVSTAVCLSQRLSAL